MFSGFTNFFFFFFFFFAVLENPGGSCCRDELSRQQIYS
jgi:hypothetical protein